MEPISLGPALWLSFNSIFPINFSRRKYYFPKGPVYFYWNITETPEVLSKTLNLAF